jgi:hypothetical protein
VGSGRRRSGVRIRVDFDDHGLRLAQVEATVAPPTVTEPSSSATGFLVQACDAQGRVLHAVPVTTSTVVPRVGGGVELLPPQGTFEAVLPWPESARWIAVLRREGPGLERPVARFGLTVACRPG